MKMSKKEFKVYCKIYVVLIVVVLFSIIMSVVTFYQKKDNEPTIEETDYKSLLKEYYENNDQVWNDEVEIVVLSEDECAVNLKVICPNEEACIALPNTLSVIEDNKWTFTITAVLDNNKINALYLPNVSETNSLLTSIWEKLGTQINQEMINEASVIETIYYGLIDNKISYLVNIEYSCEDNTNCLNVQEETRNENGKLIASYIVQFSLNENNGIIISDVLPSANIREKVLKYEETPSDPQSYEKEIVKEYMLKNELLTEESLILIEPNEGIIISCMDGSASCTNISTTVLEERENGYFLKCSYDIVATEFNKVYVSYLEF